LNNSKYVTNRMADQFAARPLQDHMRGCVFTMWSTLARTVTKGGTAGHDQFTKLPIARSPRRHQALQTMTSRHSFHVVNWHCWPVRFAHN